MWLGTRRLILLQVPAGVRSVASRLPVTVIAETATREPPPARIAGVVDPSRHADAEVDPAGRAPLDAGAARLDEEAVGVQAVGHALRR